MWSSNVYQWIVFYGGILILVHDWLKRSLSDYQKVLTCTAVRCVIFLISPDALWGGGSHWAVSHGEPASLVQSFSRWVLRVLSLTVPMNSEYRHVDYQSGSLFTCFVVGFVFWGVRVFSWGKTNRFLLRFDCLVRPVVLVKVWLFYIIIITGYPG